MNMDKHIKAAGANPPREKNYVYVAWVYAAILVVMVFVQLFAFEEFVPLIRNYWLESPLILTTLVACVIVFMEIFALPFLLRMKLSPLMRWFSMACGVLVAIGWFKFGLISAWYGYAIENSGLLGSKLVVPAGGTLMLIGLGLLLLAGLSAYGLWPHAAAKKRSKKA